MKIIKIIRRKKKFYKGKGNVSEDKNEKKVTGRKST